MTDNRTETGETDKATPTKEPGTATGRDKRGRFRAGAPSANPRGRPTESHELKALAREKSPEAIKRLLYWLRSDDPSASIQAAKELLSRGYGRPEQSIAVDATIAQARIYPAWDDMGPEEAAQAYQEMLRDVDGKMQFAPPRPKPPATAPTLAAPRPAAPAVVVPILRAEPPESVQAPTSPQPHPVEQEYIPADPAPPSMSQQQRDLWERLGRPANPEEALSALDAALRQQHVHRPMADSICPGCRAMWVRG